MPIDSKSSTTSFVVLISSISNWLPPLCWLFFDLRSMDVFNDWTYILFIQDLAIIFLHEFIFIYKTFMKTYS